MNQEFYDAVEANPVIAVIELLQHFGIFLESLLLQEVYHALHGAAHGVVVHEIGRAHV